MGAWDRRFENRIERELAEQKTKGILEAPSAYDNGHLVPPTQWAAGDVRASIPPLGLREYWYPALPANKVGSKPLFWTMLGDEMVFFRDAQGEVVRAGKLDARGAHGGPRPLARQRYYPAINDPTGPDPAPCYRQRRDYGESETVPLVLEGREVAHIPVRDVLP